VVAFGEEANMSDNVLALLVHGHPEPFESLTRTLRDLSVETYSVESCKETEDLISHCKPPIIFTEESLVDGSWVSILNIADSTDVPLSVIVVGAVPDMHQYLSVMERGAFDFVAPPFEHEPLNFVIRSAALNTHRRREALRNCG
jgi:DNA-binding NtrC family response regulator